MSPETRSVTGWRAGQNSRQPSRVGNKFTRDGNDRPTGGVVGHVPYTDPASGRGPNADARASSLFHEFGHAFEAAMGHHSGEGFADAVENQIRREMGWPVKSGSMDLSRP